jgi:hypothetical protein
MGGEIRGNGGRIDGSRRLLLARQRALPTAVASGRRFRTPRTFWNGSRTAWCSVQDALMPSGSGPTCRPANRSGVGERLRLVPQVGPQPMRAARPMMATEENAGRLRSSSGGTAHSSREVLVRRLPLMDSPKLNRALGHASTPEARSIAAGAGHCGRQCPTPSSARSEPPASCLA